MLRHDRPGVGVNHKLEIGSLGSPRFGSPHWTRFELLQANWHSNLSKPITFRMIGTNRWHLSLPGTQVGHVSNSAVLSHKGSFVQRSLKCEPSDAASPSVTVRKKRKLSAAGRRAMNRGHEAT